MTGLYSAHALFTLLCGWKCYLCAFFSLNKIQHSVSTVSIVYSFFLTIFYAVSSIKVVVLVSLSLLILCIQSPPFALLRHLLEELFCLLGASDTNVLCFSCACICMSLPNMVNMYSQAWHKVCEWHLTNSNINKHQLYCKFGGRSSSETMRNQVSAPAVNIYK